MSAHTEPNLLRIVTRLNVGGPSRHVLILDRELRNRGFDCTLVAGTEEGREGSLKPSGGDLVTIPELRRSISPLRDLKAGRRIGDLVEEKRPRIVHTHMAKAGALGRRAARRAGVPVIVHTFHGHVLEGYFSPLKNRALIALERRLARWTDALVAVSERVKDDLLGLGIGREEQWHVVPLGLELDPLLALPPGRGLRQPLVDTSGPVVGIVGRLVPIKDHELFLQTARLIKERVPDAFFVVAGDGDLRVELQARATAMLGDRVRFVGWAEDLERLYAGLDVVVLTSRNEGTPVALIEASASARPVVATDVGGVSDVVRHGETGFLAAHGDAAALAVAVVDLIVDRSRATKMGLAGRAWVKDRFGYQRLVTDIEDLYDSLLDRKGLPRAQTDRS